MAFKIKYGCKWDEEIYDDLRIELEAYENMWHGQYQFLTPFQHFKNASKIIWPNLVHHEWSDEKLASLCDPGNAYRVGDMWIWNVTWLGCATSGKTFDAGHFAMCWWLVNPSNSIVIMCSTTGKMIRKRVWPVIQELYHTHQVKHPVTGQRVDLGYLIDSQATLNAQQGDSKHCIFCKAVGEGETSKAVADIQGQHAERMMIVIDEATDTPEAIFATIPNLRKGTRRLVILTIGNPTSKLNPLGLMSEPKEGWPSINRYTRQWRTKGVKEWQVPPGVALHFAGRDSPNVKSKKTWIPFLYTYEDFLESKGNEESLSFWIFDEGFYPPEGVCHTVFSETMVDMYDGRGRLEFKEVPEVYAALDPAFGGNECVLQFGLVGMIEGNQVGIQLTEWMDLETKISADKTIDLQIAERVKDECTMRGVKPGNFGMDTTGSGRGVFSHLHTNWDNGIVAVQFGGPPSDMASSISDPRKSSEVYDRKVTELWFKASDFLKGGQLRGLYNEAIKEFTTREYEIVSRGGRKLRVIPKEEMKQKLHYSPDHADAIVVLIEVARRNGAAARFGQNSLSDSNWKAVAKRYDSVYASKSSQTSPIYRDQLDKYAVGV